MRFLLVVLAITVVSIPSILAQEGSGQELSLNVGGHHAPVRKLFFAPDGNRLVSVGSDRTIRCWDTQLGQLVDTLYLPHEEIVGGYSGVIADLAPCGAKLAIHLQGPKANTSRILIIDLLGRRVEKVYRSLTHVRFLQYSSNGQRLFIGSEWEAECLHLDGMKQLWKHKLPQRSRDFCVQSDETMWISCYPKERNIGIELTFSVDGKGKLSELPSRWPEVGRLVYHPTEKQFISKSTTTSSSDSGIVIYSAEGKELQRCSSRLVLEKIRPEVRSCSFAQILPVEKQKRIVVAWYSSEETRGAGHWGVSFLNMETGKVDWTTSQQGTYDYLGIAAAVSPNGKTVALAGGSDHSILLYEKGTDNFTHRLGGSPRTPRCLGWSSENKLIGLGDSPLGKDWRVAWDTKNLSLVRDPRLLETLNGPILQQDGIQIQTQGNEWKFTVDKKKVAKIHDVDDSVFSPLSLHPTTKELLFGRGRFLRVVDPRNDKQFKNVLVPDRDWAVNITAITPSLDGKFLFIGTSNSEVKVHAFLPTPPACTKAPLLSVFCDYQNWIAWTPQGYYAASPGGERLMGWVVSNGSDKLATFHPAERFRKTLYRPDIVRRVLELGSVEKAIEAANKEANIKGVIEEIQQVAPPKVRILLPTEPVVTFIEPKKLVIEAEAESTKANPVSKLQLIVDNVGQKENERTVRAPGDKDKVTGSWTIEFTTPGIHKVYVRVEGEKSNGATNAIYVEYNPKLAPKLKRPTLHVLAVGIDLYPGDQILKCAVNDAVKLADTFKKFSAALYEDVNVVKLQNQEATRGQILGALKGMGKKMEPDDVVIVFYAGHGFRLQKGKNELNSECYLLPFGGDKEKPETTCVSSKDLRQAIMELKSRNILVILDACHGGRPSDLIRELADEGCGAGVFLAAQDSEKAGEKEGHGHFTRAIIETLEGKALPKSAKDRRVLLTDLSFNVVRRVRDLSDEKQNPICLGGKPIPLTVPPGE